MKKADLALLQAADILVWQFAKFIKDRASNKRAMRKDFQSLLQHRHKFSYVGTKDRNVIVVWDEGDALLDLSN